MKQKLKAINEHDYPGLQRGEKRLDIYPILSGSRFFLGCLGYPYC